MGQVRAVEVTTANTEDLWVVRGHVVKHLRIRETHLGWGTSLGKELVQKVRGSLRQAEVRQQSQIGRTGRWPNF
jgi:hypothetical protein